MSYSINIIESILILYEPCQSSLGIPHGVVVNMLDCDIIASKFELQSWYYIHFQTNTYGKSTDPLMPPAMD